MKILQLGDTHLGRACRHLGGPPGYSRAADHAEALERALLPALQGAVDLVVHTGDLFDRSRPPAAAVAHAKALFGAVAACVPTVLLAGNHDRHGVRKHWTSLPRGLVVVDAPTALTVAGLRLALVPHARQAAAWAAAAARVAPGCDALITHQGVDGVRVAGFTFTPGRPAETLAAHHLPPGVPRVLSGHIHPHQCVQLGGVSVVYAGSTERTSARETEPKGTVTWQVGRRWSWRFRPDPLARPVVVVDCEDDLELVSVGDWVSVAPRLLRTLAGAVVARGGIVALPSAAPRTPRAQLSLFSRRAVCPP